MSFVHIREGTLQNIENETLMWLFENKNIALYETGQHFNTKAKPPRHSVSTRIGERVP